MSHSSIFLPGFPALTPAPCTPSSPCRRIPSSAHLTPSSPRVLMANLVLKANPVMLVLKAMPAPLAPLAPLAPPAPS